MLLKGLGPVHWFLPENSQYSIQNSAVARKAVFLPKIIMYFGWFNVDGVFNSVSAVTHNNYL